MDRRGCDYEVVVTGTNVFVVAGPRLNKEWMNTYEKTVHATVNNYRTLLTAIKTQKPAGSPRVLLFREFYFLTRVFFAALPLYLSPVFFLSMPACTALSTVEYTSGSIFFASSGVTVLIFFNMLRTLDTTPFLLDRKSTRLNSSHANISYAV